MTEFQEFELLQKTETENNDYHDYPALTGLAHIRLQWSMMRLLVWGNKQTRLLTFFIIYKTGGWRQIKIRAPAPAATFDGILFADFERHTATQEFECVIFKMVKLLPRK
jgi:hypothetical protein